VLKLAGAAAPGLPRSAQPSSVEDHVPNASRAVPQASFPRAFWYAAIASQRLADKPVAARVLDAELALYRDGGGRARALQDRCAHRGAQLSLGEVTEGRLACRYHGWRYGGDGQCGHIPSLADGKPVPRGIGVRAYACAEADGYVYVWMGEGEPSRPAPVTPQFAGYDWAQGVLELNCAALAAIENNLDWCHPAFAHPYTHPQFFLNQAQGFTEKTIEARPTENGMVVFGPLGDGAAEPGETLVTLGFELPDRIAVSFLTPQGRMHVLMNIVPTGEATCRQEWMVSTGPAAAAPQVVWSDEPQPILEQDRAVLESLQRATDREGHGFEHSVEVDAATLVARRIYAAACGAARGATPKRRRIKVRS
jgi:phenylpropionate dioxygenase-like ring-hydroxylating dioxygenase large terminal subunit